MKLLPILFFLSVQCVFGLVDFNLESNAKEHHTDKYKLSTRALIIRRGQAFHVSVTDAGKDAEISAVLKYVRTNGDSNQPTFNVPITRSEDDADTGSFFGIARQESENQTKVSIQSPVSASIGMYTLEISVTTKGNETEKYVEDKVYLLFNPWNRDDQVYLPDEHARSEYVLNDVGKVYLGSSNYYSDKRWIFGQFEETILDAVLFLLDQNRFDLNHTLRSDVTSLSRVLSSLVNANDGFGVIAGNWNPPYYGGENPASWSSSVDILEKYYDSRGQAVRWGQCWVFAAVLTTVCRTLGIPARPITTFASAHDTDDSLTIDTFTDANGNEMNMGSDSVWNFHAWTEAWFSRNDLGSSASAVSGWQVIDSTPQEVSDGIFQTGPGSVQAVKKGLVNLPYDLHFIFSEVSSATVHWKEDPSVPLGWRKITTNTYENGDLIVTKKIGPLTDEKDAENITATYKFDDPKERQIVFLNAALKAGVDLLLLEKSLQETEHVQFELLPINETLIGDDVIIKLRLNSIANETVFVKSVIRVDSTYYNGITGARIKKQESEFAIAQSQSDVIEVTIPFNDYYDRLVEHNLLHIYIDAIVSVPSDNHPDHSTDNPLITIGGAGVNESKINQFWTEERDFAFKMPKLTVELISFVKSSNLAKFRVSFANPLGIQLRNGVVTVKGLRKYIEFSVNTINPKESVSYDVVVKLDNHPLVIFSLDSDQLTDVRGSTQINMD